MRRPRKRRNDFKKHDDYYDLYEDWDLIESSFAQQYGIRLRQEDEMSWSEFCTLLSGIMPDTPLGRIVSIRSEKDPKVLKNFTKEQKDIRNKWILRRNEKLKEDPVAYKAYLDNFQSWCKAAFGKK